MKIREDITNSQLEETIDQYIRSEKYRDILKRKLIDGLTYEATAEEFDMSPRQIKTIIKEQGAKIIARL